MLFHDTFCRYAVMLVLAALWLPFRPALAAEPASLGDLRVANAILTDRSGLRIGELHGTLTTTAIDTPGPRDEIRQSNLVFQVGRPQDQIVVGGESAYPASSSTIATSTTIVRPILGGSGRYAGARGTARTDHFDDGTWRHVFRLMP